MSLIKCKIWLRTWFSEGDGKIKTKARTQLAMEDCWALCFPVYLIGSSVAEFKSCQFVYAADICFQGSRDAINAQKESNAFVTDCQFEAFGIAFNAKH